jgi:iron complex outermembrane receptor protein
MAYARFSSGYRPGGPNLGAGIVGIQNSFNPDTTNNYEIGTKGTLFDNMLSFDASLYYIDWNDMQVTLTQGIFSYTSNVGAAKSQGVELTLLAAPVDGMSISTWFSYNDAVLTRGFPANSSAFGVPGDRLPYSGKYAASFSFDQAFPLANDWTGSLGGTVSYVGDRLGEFNFTSLRQDLPDYTKVDLRAELKRGLWAIDFYVNNVADSRGITGGGIGNADTTAFEYITPRTIGLNVTRNF